MGRCKRGRVRKLRAIARLGFALSVTREAGWVRQRIRDDGGGLLQARAAVGRGKPLQPVEAIDDMSPAGIEKRRRVFRQARREYEAEQQKRQREKAAEAS